MKKTIIIALLAYLGLGILNYLFMRSQITNFSARKFNEFLDVVAENNSGMACDKVEPFGSELPLEFFYSTEYVATTFLTDPKGRPFKIAVNVTDPTLPPLRPLGLSRAYVTIKNSYVRDLFEQKQFCEKKKG